MFRLELFLRNVAKFPLKRKLKEEEISKREYSKKKGRFALWGIKGLTESNDDKKKGRLPSNATGRKGSETGFL